MHSQFLLALIVALCLVLIGIRPACAEGVDLSGIIARLAEQDIHVSEEQAKVFADVYSEGKANIDANSYMPDMYKDLMRAQFQTESGIAHELLFYLGQGTTDPETGAWTATSSEVYAFDAEVFDIDHMYTLFLQGVQAIVPEIEITDVRDDFNWDDIDGGMRGVSFVCNGTPYSVELESQGDWLNWEIVDFMNDVLLQEDCPGRLYGVTADDDQMVILLYGSYGRAVAVSELLDVR